MQLRFPPLAIEASELACVRGGRAIFSGLSFRVKSGELLTVTGRNGSGKSSLLRLVAGLLTLSVGALRFEGRGEDEPVAHYLGHADALKPALTVRETLRFWRTLYGEETDRAEGAADATDLGHALDLPMRVLSAGQRRRAGLARLLVAPRPLWLLDEPTASLDADGIDLLGRILKQHLDEGGLAIAATHQALPVPSVALVKLSP